jgi:hypothetical protein
VKSAPPGNSKVPKGCAALSFGDPGAWLPQAAREKYDPCVQGKYDESNNFHGGNYTTGLISKELKIPFWDIARKRSLYDL